MSPKILFTLTIAFWCFFNMSSVLALPNMDKTVGVSTFSDYTSYILRDDEDENVFYLPFTRIALASVEGDSKSPDFSFVYMPEGLIIQLGVEVTVDKARLRPLMTEIKAKNPAAKFRYLPVQTGRFMPTLRNNMGIDTYVKSQTDFNIAHNNPREKRALSFLFTESMANLIVLSIKNGGGFAINYEYQFKAAVTKSSARVKIHWEAVNQVVETQSQAGTLSLAGINELVRQMQTNRTISIQLVGDSNHLGTILKRITTLIRDSCFQPVSSTGINPMPAGFAIRQKGCENKTEEFFYQTTPIEEFTGLAGFQLPGMCFTHPKHFRFMDKDGQFVTGCPNSVYGKSREGLSVLTKKPTLKNPEIPNPIIP
ncbi:hypothetical protein [Candidatus Parabeggiatoa sp. HSG14]|uniref:hypothetical protein n=1 Tax=Candidatus Parabeggiatoa sp. HSG14 TaxID=3055593 RepID=UPI0025A81689|nr:hypothetical protein [Thiotrichales bacterium HSG14]